MPAYLHVYLHTCTCTVCSCTSNGCSLLHAHASLFVVTKLIFSFIFDLHVHVMYTCDLLYNNKALSSKHTLSFTANCNTEFYTEVHCSAVSSDCTMHVGVASL